MKSYSNITLIIQRGKRKIQITMSCAAPTPTTASNAEEDKKPEIFSHIELKVKGQVRFFVYINFMYLIFRFMYFCSFLFSLLF